MKKIFALTLALLLCFAIVACNDDGITLDSDGDVQSNSESSTVQTPEDSSTEGKELENTTEPSNTEASGTSSEDGVWTGNY